MSAGYCEEEHERGFTRVEYGIMICLTLMFIEKLAFQF